MKKFNKRTLIFLSLVVVGMLLFAGCQKKVGSLLLKVQGPDSAQVTVKNGTTKTATVEGAKEFKELPAGKYTVKIESEGYKTKEQAITIKGGATNTVTISLVEEESAETQTKAKYNVKINIVDSKGNKLSGKAVIDGADGTQNQEVEAGVLEFEASPGEYNIEIKRRGYKDVNKTITVKDGDQELDITLQPKKFDLSVQVVDGNNNPLTATIFLKTDEEVKEMKEDSAANFEDITAGEYKLEILRDGYEDTIKTIDLTENKEITAVMKGGNVQQHLITKGSSKNSITIKDLGADQEAIIAASYLNYSQAPQGFNGSDLEYKARQRGLKLIKEYGADFKVNKPQYSLGDTKEFAIANDVKEGSVTATLEAKGEHIYVFVDSNEQVSQTKLDDLVTNFDTNIYPRLTPNKSKEDRVVVLLTEFDRAEKTEPYVTGFFDPADLYPGAGNQAVMFYLNSTRSKNTLLTAAAHQYQHLVFFAKKAQANRTVNDAWIDQGLAHLASQLCGYINFEKRGWSDEEANGWVYDQEYGYLHNTDQVNALYHDGSLPFTGSSALLTAYLIEQNDPKLMQQIMNTSNDPVQVIEEYTGQQFEQIYANWMTTNVSDNIPAIDSEVYNYSSFDLNMMPAFNQGKVSNTGVSYFKVSGSGGDLSLNLPDNLEQNLIIVVIKKAK